MRRRSLMLLSIMIVAPLTLKGQQLNCSNYFSQTFGSDPIITSAAFSLLSPAHTENPAGFGASFARDMVNRAEFNTARLGFDQILNEGNCYHPLLKGGVLKRGSSAIMGTFFVSDKHGSKKGFAFGFIAAAVVSSYFHSDVEHRWGLDVIPKPRFAPALGFRVTGTVGTNLLREFQPDMKNKLERSKPPFKWLAKLF